LQRNPTIASKYLRKELRLEGNYLDDLPELRFLSGENFKWPRSIKGDGKNDDYPADQF
jgi:ATP-dependent DNA helicase RecQ